MLPPCLKGEGNYIVVSVVAVIVYLVVVWQARKFARCYCLVNARIYVRSASIAIFTQMRLAVRSCGGNTYRQTENIKVGLYSTLCKINSHNHSYLQYHGGAVVNGA